MMCTLFIDKNAQVATDATKKSFVPNFLIACLHKTLQRYHLLHNDIVYARVRQATQDIREYVNACVCARSCELSPCENIHSNQISK